MLEFLMVIVWLEKQVLMCFLKISYLQNRISCWNSNGYCVVEKTGINVVFKDFFEAKSI